MKVNKLTALALLTGIALTIFVLESQLPPIVPIPGVKLGLANIVTLVALYLYGRKEAGMVLAARIIMGGIFAGSASSLLFSITGGTFCFFIMALTKSWFPQKQLWVVSVFGALFHNGGQLLAAVCVMGTASILAYAPVLVISAVITGAFTGLCAQYLMGPLKKWLSRSR